MSKKATRRPASHGELHRLLVSTFPEHRTTQNVFDIPGFAGDLGYAHETLYKAVRQRDPLKLAVAFRIIKYSHTNQAATPLYWRDLVKFVLPGFAEYEKPSEIADLLG